MTVPSPATAVEVVAATLPGVLAERSPSAIAHLLAEDVRWGSAQDTEQTCHDRRAVLDLYAELLAGGMALEVLETGLRGQQVRARLRITGPDDRDGPGSEVYVVLTVRDGLVVDILQLTGEEYAPTCELLHVDGCPNHEDFLPHLQSLLRSNGMEGSVRLVEVQSDEDAQRLRFLGSPSLRVDGRDVEPGAGQRTDYGLQCRVYRTPAGLTGTPPDEWVRAALGL